MVTTERRRYSLPKIEAVLKKCHVKEKALVVEELKNTPVRMKAPPPPEGGIGIREASRKYGVSDSSLSRWVKAGAIPVITRTKNWLYIDERALKIYLEGKRFS